MYRPSRFHSPSRRRTLLAALVLALLPLANAAAQDLPRVRVTRDDTAVRAMRSSKNDRWLLARAEAGTLFDVLMADGDRRQYRESNWYLVLLPRDEWGTQWAGWIPGRSVALAPPRERALSGPTLSKEILASSPADAAALDAVDASRAAAPAAPTPTTGSAVRVIPDVVLRFAFDRSDLAETAKHDLVTALSTTGTEARSLSFALGGHADATGSDIYNQKLGLARADAVRKYLVEQLQVPADRISVTSYGEAQPVASNDTRAGRAENRRVVVTVMPVTVTAAVDGAR